MLISYQVDQPQGGPPVTVTAEETTRVLIWHGDLRIEIVETRDNVLTIRQLANQKLLIKPEASNAIELRAVKY